MIHHVYANQSNIGDWLSAQGIQKLLGAQPVKEYLCDGPFVQETIGKLESVSSEDLIVVGGGGLFMDYFSQLWEGLRRLGRRTPYCLWGVGFCDLKNEPSRPALGLLRDVVKKSCFSQLRDQHSIDILGLPNLSPPVPCPSLCIVEEPSDPGEGILHVDNYTTAGEQAYEAMDAAARRQAASCGCAYRSTNNRIPAGNTQKLAEVLGLYARSQFVISSALHGCVIATGMGKRVLAVSGDHKIDAYMRAINLGEWVLDASEIDLIPAALERLPQQPSIKKSLDHARQANEEIAKRILAIHGKSA